MTNWCVSEYLKGRGGQLRPEARRFFTKIAAIVNNQAPSSMSDATRHAIWHSISFYNYIPRIAARGPGLAPPEYLWHGEAPEAFRQILRRLEVEVVLVCGERLWSRLPSGMKESTQFRFEGQQRTTRLYSIGEPYRAIAAHMWHPSSGRGWSFQRWRPVLDFLFEQVKLDRERTGAPALFAV